MKYIRFKENGFLVFSDVFSHATMAEAIPRDIPISAGSLKCCEEFDNGKPILNGQSYTLGLKSLPTDTEDFRRQASR
jgi:hypothetical protein